MSRERSSDDKNEHAVALGSRGGRIGGRVRAERLSSARRSEIALRAAQMRWGKKDTLPNRARKNAKPNVEHTRQRILEAAHEEFTKVGLTGARVDRIAESAGVNKRMLYHYFGGKEELFRQMLRRSLLELTQAEATAPQNLEDELVYWRELMRSNPDWIRLSLWEALTYDSENIIGEEERSIFWQKAIEQIKQDQSAGNIDAGFDPSMLQLYLFAFVAFPLLLPQMTKLITGHAPDESEFLERQDEFLRRFGNLLTPVPFPLVIQ